MMDYNIENEKQFYEQMEGCDDPQKFWDGKAATRYLTDETISWLLPLADWKIGLTLTFREFTYPDIAKSYWSKLVKVLNKELFGEHYTKRVKHSYFSYAYGIEYQKRDVIHFHAIIDKPVNFGKIHSFWNRWAGFAWTDVIKSKEGCVSYIAKYNLKGGQVEVYLAKKDYVPNVIPFWWKENQENTQLDLFETGAGLLADRETASQSARN